MGLIEDDPRNGDTAEKRGKEIIYKKETQHEYKAVTKFTYVLFPGAVEVNVLTLPLCFC